MLLQGGAALNLHVFQRGQRREVAVDHRLVRQPPQALSGLEFRRIRRQKQQVQPLGHMLLDLLTCVPARLIEHQDDLMLRPGADRASELLQHDAEHREVDRGGPLPQRVAGGWTDKAHQIDPLVAGLHRRDQPMLPPPSAPDPTEDGLEPQSMLIHRPTVDLGCRVLLTEFIDRSLRPFLKTSCASWSAALT